MFYTQHTPSPSRGCDMGASNGVYGAPAFTSSK